MLIATLDRRCVGKNSLAGENGSSFLFQGQAPPGFTTFTFQRKDAKEAKAQRKRRLRLSLHLRTLCVFAFKRMDAEMPKAYRFSFPPEILATYESIMHVPLPAAACGARDGKGVLRWPLMLKQIPR